MRALAIGLCVVALGGCASATPDSFTVRRFSTIVGVAFAPLERTVSDASAASRLLEKIRSLPPEAANRFCASDQGLRYDVKFQARGAEVLHAVAQAGGCRVLDLGSGDRRDTDESFWAELAGDLGYYTRGTDLFPMPLGRQ